MTHEQLRERVALKLVARPCTIGISHPCAAERIREWRMAKLLARGGKARGGRYRAARRVWHRYAGRNRHFEMARRFARLGDQDRALSALEESYQQREGNMVVVGSDPIFAPLRSQERFQAVARAVHGSNP